MNKNIHETELSYYGLYLLNYLKEHRFVEAKDLSFVQSRPTVPQKSMSRHAVKVIPLTGHRSWLWQTSCADSTFRNTPC